MYHKGQLNEVYKEVRRYGKIHHLEDVEHSGGLSTYAYIEHKQTFWEFELVRGDVVECSWKLENNWPF